MKLAIFYYIVLPVLILLGVVFSVGASIYGNVEVCRNHYSEMSLVGCMFSSKTVITPGGRK